MAEHQFGILDQHCVGCGIEARMVADAPRLANACPAYYAKFMDEGDELRLVIRPEDERLTVWRSDGLPKFSLAASAMFELRDHIELGVRRIREAKDQ